jgi:hypothetical protein
MRKVLWASAIVVLGLSFAMNASASMSKRLVRDSASGAPYGLSADCTINSGNNCAGWVWVWSTSENDVWGTVLDADDCAGGCANGGAVTDISMRLYCLSAPPPGTINNVGVTLVDGNACPTGAPLYSSGPITATHCTTGSDRWQTLTIPATHTAHNPFAVTVTWGPVVGTSNNPQFSTSAGIANYYCEQTGVIGFPGCAATTSSCAGWGGSGFAPIHTYIYVSGGVDLCATYGVPYALQFPYVYGVGYAPNNLMINVGLDCYNPTATEAGSWGHVKSLYQ